MYLSVKISRLSNFLCFIQKGDKTYLGEFDLQKYLPDENFDLMCYEQNNDKIWEQVEKFIGKRNIKQFKNDIAHLGPIFAPYWRKESKHLLSWKRYFQINRLLFQQVISDIKKLNGIKYFGISEVPIYLISDPAHKDKEIHAWFSWTPQKSFVVIEIPTGLKPLNNLLPVSILTHEFFHLVLRENKSLYLEISKVAEEKRKLFARLSRGMPSRIFLEELLISSFVPEGYLGEKYFHTKISASVVKPKSLLMWRRFIAYKLNKTAKDYVSNTRQIDRIYLKNLVTVIKQK